MNNRGINRLKIEPRTNAFNAARFFPRLLLPSCTLAIVRNIAKWLFGACLMRTTMLNSRFTYISVLALGAVFSNAAHAQLFGGLKDRLVNAVESRVEQKMEERVIQV